MRSLMHFLHVALPSHPNLHPATTCGPSASRGLASRNACNKQQQQQHTPHQSQPMPPRKHVYLDADVTPRTCFSATFIRPGQSADSFVSRRCGSTPALGSRVWPLARSSTVAVTVAALPPAPPPVPPCRPHIPAGAVLISCAVCGEFRIVGRRPRGQHPPVHTCNSAAVVKMQRTFGNSSSSARLRFLLNGDATPPPPPPPPVAHPPPLMVDKACQIELHLLGRVPDLLGHPSDHHDAVRECSTARDPRPPPTTTTLTTRNTPLRRTLELEEAIELFDDVAEPELRTASTRRAEGLPPTDGVKGGKVVGGPDRGAEEDGCGVRCLYVAVQCCECIIL